MTDPRNHFSTSDIADPSAVKAHAALYGALDGVDRAEPVVVVARARDIPQGGSAVVQAVRARLIAEGQGPDAGGQAPSTAQASEGVSPRSVLFDAVGRFARPAMAGASGAEGPEEGKGQPARASGWVPRAAILRFRLSELPSLAGALTGQGESRKRREPGG
jgi:hypothetical protein